MRSCAQWLSINTGHGLAAGESLVRIGHALETLPLIAEAFAAGELSLDKVRQLCTVATPTDEQVWLELGRQASGAQLTPEDGARVHAALESVRRSLPDRRRRAAIPRTIATPPTVPTRSS